MNETLDITVTIKIPTEHLEFDDTEDAIRDRLRSWLQDECEEEAPGTVVILHEA